MPEPGSLQPFPSRAISLCGMPDRSVKQRGVNQSGAAGQGR
jgi:hypothetical protein